MASGGLGRSLFNIVTSIFKFWKLSGIMSITAIIIVVGAMGAVQEAWQQKSLVPIAQKIGRDLIGADYDLYVEGKMIQAQGGLIERDAAGNIVLFEFVKSLAFALSKFWYLYFYIWVFYKLIIWAITQNKSLSFPALLVTLLVFSGFTIVGHFVVEDQFLEDLDPEYKISAKDKFNPFVGSWEFIKASPLIFKDVNVAIPKIENLVGG